MATTRHSRNGSLADKTRGLAQMVTGAIGISVPRGPDASLFSPSSERATAGEDSAPTAAAARFDLETWLTGGGISVTVKNEDKVSPSLTKISFSTSSSSEEGMDADADVDADNEGARWKAAERWSSREVSAEEKVRRPALPSTHGTAETERDLVPVDSPETQTFMEYLNPVISLASLGFGCGGKISDYSCAETRIIDPNHDQDAKIEKISKGESYDVGDKTSTSLFEPVRDTTSSTNFSLRQAGQCYYRPNDRRTRSATSNAQERRGGETTALSSTGPPVRGERRPTASEETGTGILSSSTRRRSSDHNNTAMTATAQNFSDNMQHSHPRPDAARQQQGTSEIFQPLNQQGHRFLKKHDKQQETQRRIWMTAVDPKTGRTYYYDKVTRETQWRKPIELASDEERQTLQRKDKELKEFFAVMEGNIIQCMEQGALPGSPLKEAEEEETVREMSSPPVKPAAIKMKKSSIKLLSKSAKPKGGPVRTISSMNNDVLAEMTKLKGGSLSSLEPSVTSFPAADHDVAHVRRTADEMASGEPLVGVGIDLGLGGNDPQITTSPKISNLRELAKPNLEKRNTCGTIYVGTTMSAPDKDATIKVRGGGQSSRMLPSS